MHFCSNVDELPRALARGSGRPPPRYWGFNPARWRAKAQKKREGDPPPRAKARGNSSTLLQKFKEIICTYLSKFQKRIGTFSAPAGFATRRPGRWVTNPP